MPRGDNPNSRKNLRPTNTLSREQHLKQSSKGGTNAAITKRLLASFRDIDAENTTYEERKQMLDAIKLKARKGNIRAFEVYRDTVGEKPGENVEISGSVPDDGFVEALRATVAEDWGDAEHEETDGDGV